jgi:hypothetical protein
MDTAKLLSEAERKAAGRPDMEDSERAANEILTNEVDRLKAELAEARAEIERMATSKAKMQIACDRHGSEETRRRRDAEEDLVELRRKIGEWADLIDDEGNREIAKQMREETLKR